MFRLSAPVTKAAMALPLDSLRSLSNNSKHFSTLQHPNHRKVDKELSKVRIAIFLACLEWPVPFCEPGCENSFRHPVDSMSVLAANNADDVSDADTAIAVRRARPRRLRLKHPNDPSM